MELISNQFDTREIRRALSLSVEGFARKLDIAANTIRRWESGDHAPQPRMLRKLAMFVEAEQPTLHWTR